MKRVGVFCLAALLGLSCPNLPGAFANGNGPANGSQVTHDELADMLMNLLGLTRFPEQSAFDVLRKNQIAPPPDWEAGKVVSKGDFAVVLVKCLKAMGETVDLPDLNDKNAAMQWLSQAGISFTTIGEGTSIVEPLANPVGVQVFSPDTDPLTDRERFSPTDEQESGADAEYAWRGPEVAPPAPLPVEEPITRQIITRIIGGGRLPFPIFIPVPTPNQPANAVFPLG